MTDQAEDRVIQIIERLTNTVRSGYMCRIDHYDLSWCVSEINRLRAELDAAAKRSAYWKAEHLAGNDEIARLRAENERLVAARLRPETVEVARSAMTYFSSGIFISIFNDAVSDFNRCYPPEED